MRVAAFTACMQAAISVATFLRSMRIVWTGVINRTSGS
jgi:hypothetical protein